MSKFLEIPDRDAWGTIRGFVYQVDMTILRWLDLKVDEALELERGEDIDIIRSDLAGGEISRALEQIKYQQSAISLNQDKVLDTIFNFYLHKVANQEPLSFRYVTNADYTVEKPAIFLTGSGIEAWISLFSDQSAGQSDERLHIIQRHLLNRAENRLTQGDVRLEWSDFVTYLTDSRQCLDLIKTFEWSTKNEDHKQITRLISHKIALNSPLSTDEQLQLIYHRLFFYIFKLLTIPNLKRIDRLALSEQMRLPELSLSDQKIYDFLIEAVFNLNIRMARIEQSLGTSTEMDQGRQDLLTGLQKRYENRFQTKLKSEVGFTLETSLEYVKDGTSENYIRDFYLNSTPRDPIDEFDKLYEQYTAELWNILILGQPGAGKTVLLLRFALKLLEAANADHLHPIPVILNLATWRQNEHNFQGWLEANLVSAAGKYGISKRYAKYLVGLNNFTLLLDGLDEIPSEDRASCLVKLADFINGNQDRTAKNGKKYPRLIICSRIKEYIETPADAPVWATLKIAPLKFGAILEQLSVLKISNNRAKALYRSLVDHPDRYEMLTTAFDVHIALHLALEQNFPTLSDRQELINAYCSHEIAKVGRFKPEEVLKYLHHTAGILDAFGIVTFELVNIQPFWTYGRFKNLGRDWTGTERFYKIFLEVYRSVLLFGMLFCSFLIFIVSDHQSTLIAYQIATGISLAIALIMGITLGILNAKDPDNFLVSETKRFSCREFKWKIFRENFGHSFKKTFFLFLVIAIVCGLMVGIGEIQSGLKLSGEVLSYALAIVAGNLANGFSIVPDVLIYTIMIGCAAFAFFNWRYVIKGKVKSQSPWYVRKDLLLIPMYFCYAFTGIGLVLGICYGLYLGPYRKFFGAVYAGVGAGLAFGAFTGLISGGFKGLMENLFVVRNATKISKAYQRFNNTLFFDFLKNAFPLNIILISILWLTKANIRDGAIFLVVLQMALIYIAMYNSPLIKHFTVRSILYCQGRVPLRYRSFLNKLSATGLVEKDGGHWRFRHQLIQDRFLAAKPVFVDDYKDYSWIPFIVLKLIGLGACWFFLSRVFNNHLWLADYIDMPGNGSENFYLILKATYIVKTVSILILPKSLSYTDMIRHETIISGFILACLAECVAYGVLFGFEPIFWQYLKNISIISVPSFILYFILTAAAKLDS